MSWAFSDGGSGADFVAVGADAGEGNGVEMARPSATAARRRRILKSIEFIVLFVQGEGIVCDR